MQYPQNHPPDLARQDATSHDQAGQAETTEDYISVKEALAIFVAHGRPCSERTIQRYCEKNKISGQKILTDEGEKWFALKSSVLHRIAELERFDKLRADRQAATSRDLSSIVAEQNAVFLSDDTQRQATGPDVSQAPVVKEISHATQPDIPRQDTSGRDVSRQSNETVQHQNSISLSERERELYEQLLATYKDRIDDLVRDKSLLQDDKKMLVEQLLSKDKQIEHFFSSERDTKKLFGSLQNIITFIWPNSKRKKPNEELPQAFAPVIRDVPDGLDERQNDGDR